MYKAKNISDGIYYVGINDRRTGLFENMWPLHRGITYNSYVIKDEKNVVIDTVEAGSFESWLERVRSVLNNEPIDYLIMNHMEPDHSGAIRILCELYPNMKIVGNKKTTPMVEGYYGISDKCIEKADGETLELGEKSLSFHTMPMVHWPESMVCFETTSQTLFSSDAFGSYGTLDGALFDSELDISYYYDEMRRYYSNIVGKYGNPVQKTLKKLADLDIKTIAPSHGPVYRESVSMMLDLYDKWSRYESEENGVVIAFASMYGNTETMAEAAARSLAENGVKNIRMYDVSKTHPSYIIADIFKYNGLILASPTYNNELHPNMEALTNKLEHMGLSNKLVAVLGSFTWAGAAVKKLNAVVEKLKWEVVANPVEEKHALKHDKYLECIELGKAMAERINR